MILLVLFQINDLSTVALAVSNVRTVRSLAPKDPLLSVKIQNSDSGITPLKNSDSDFFHLYLRTYYGYEHYDSIEIPVTGSETKIYTTS
jgi:hypothetical protein